MAGAAGVVIVSITNSQADNLEGQNAGIEARCEPWEIFDPTLAAAGRGGTPANGGLESSAIGCRRVCYVQATTANADIAAADTLDDSAQLPANDKKAKLLMSRSSLVGANGLKAKTTTAGQIQVVIGDRAAKAATESGGRESPNRSFYGQPLLPCLG